MTHERGQRWLLVLLACLHLPSGEGVFQNASDWSTGVVISLATIPGREDMLRDTIASLIAQTARVPIFVAIPETFARFPSARYKVPDWLRSLECEGVWVKRCEDRGPITKLACALEMLPGVSRIITVDDDMAYHPRVVENLIRWSDRFKGMAVAHAGHRITQAPFDTKSFWYLRPAHHALSTGASVPFPVEADVLHGWAGALYPAEKMDLGSLLDYGDLGDDAFQVDDQWVSGVLGAWRIKIMVVPSPEPVALPLAPVVAATGGLSGDTAGQIAREQRLV
ncbi:hypothetical protein T484DRAFT_1913192, partial [Baffinella frigidus]